MVRIYFIDLKNNNRLLDIEKSEIIDERMIKILLDFDNLIIKNTKSNIF